DDQISLVEAGRGGGTAGNDIGNDGAFKILGAEAGGHFGRDRLYLYTQPAARHPAMRLELRHHTVQGGGRNREADTDAAARRRENHRVHADDLAANIEGRTARVAAIDRRVDLNKVRVRTITHVAADRGHDAGCHRIAQTEGIAHRDHPVADANLTIVAELHRGQRPVAPDLDQSNVCSWIGANELCVELAPVRQFDL